MIIKENIKIGKKEYEKHHSDNGFMIERENIVYSEAIDPVDSDRKYTETNVKIEGE